MPADMPVFTIVAQIVTHTPLWVWGLLALLVALGVRQAFDTVMPRLRVMLMPIGLGAYSLYGATAMFGARAEVITAWGLAMLAVVTIHGLLRRGAGATALPDGRFAVPGSLWPLAAMLTVFALRYVGTVSLVFHPEWAREAAFSLTLAASYGALSGVFAARALHILRSGRTSSAVATARPVCAA